MTITVLCSGQSNAIGRYAGGPTFGAADSRVGVWNNVNPLGSNGTAFVTAAAAQTAGTFDPAPDSGNNFGVWFCHRLAQVRDDDVDYTLVARGGTGIEEWEPGSTVGMFEEMDAVWTATGQGPADIFLWHQGEGNTGDSYATYSAAFLALLADLTAADIIDASTIVIVGGLTEDGSSGKVDFNNNVLKLIAANNAQIYYAPTDGLVSGDGTHFTGQSLYTLGAARYFAAYMEAEGLNMVDLWALVNEGGTPGSPGTGANKLYNLLNLALIGMGEKDTTDAANFTGTPPGGNLLTAGMVAGGAIVDWGTDGSNGSWVRWESGLQLCFKLRHQLTRADANTLSGSWTYGKAFISTPAVWHTPDASTGNGNVDMLSAKRRLGMECEMSSLSTSSVSIRVLSDGSFTAGTEVLHTNTGALGFWK